MAAGSVLTPRHLAGQGYEVGIPEISDEDWHRRMDKYLLNVIQTTRMVAPIMVD
ncbi:MAG: hypothetical protein AAFY74_01310 [Pseudomonadota bacterium]